MRTMHKFQPRRWETAAVIFLAVLAGCGDDGGESLARSNQKTVTVSAKAEDNVFKPDKLFVPAGAEVTVNVENTGAESHTFTIRDLNVDTGTIPPGETKTVTFDAPDETTQFICVPHELEGMTGELMIQT
jgi:nitrite reductase (NO-forming)